MSKHGLGGGFWKLSHQISRLTPCCLGATHMGTSWVTNVRLPWRVTVPAGCPEPPEGGSRFQSSPALARTARRADEAQGPPQLHPPNMDRSSCYSLLLPSLSRTFVFRRISKTLRMFVFFLRKRPRDIAKTNMNSHPGALSVGHFSGQTDVGLGTSSATF